MPPSSDQPLQHTLPLPGSIGEWLKVFGPGAIVASLTIGTGELIFSTRGGALFGYDILFVFVVISVLKWGLVVAASRHIVLTGVHPYQRMLEFPGPRGWLPLMLLIMSILCVPVWIAFHAGVIGNLTSWVTGTEHVMDGGVDYLWGACWLTVVLTLVIAGGYSLLERVQLFIVTALLSCALITLLLYRPDWVAMLTGVVPGSLAYPDWVSHKYPGITADSVWVEVTRYVGVIGGGAFDYLAWTSWIRQKNWGSLPHKPTDEQLQQIAQDLRHPVRLWMRAPVIDSAISFALIVLFSAVFVASGALILGPREIVPDDSNLLNLQAQFVTEISDWLLPLYVAGAFLTMLGTLYGTTEVGVVIVDEIVRSFNDSWNKDKALKLKRVIVLWSGLVAMLVLAWLFVRQTQVFDSDPEPSQVAVVSAGMSESASDSSSPPPTRRGKPRLLVALLTPVSLLTGVLACGLICVLNLWMDRRFLPAALRMPGWLSLLNGLAALLFVLIGARGWWDGHKVDQTFVETRWFPLAGLILMAGLSLVAARVVRMRTDGE